MTYRSSFAIDKNNVDQQLADATPTKVTGSRVLWDLNNDFDVAESKFVCPTDGLYEFEAGMLLTDLVNVSRVQFHLYQNGVLWATVADDYIIEGQTELGVCCSCQCDGLYSNTDYFELYVQLTAAGDGDVTATLSGLREKTFFGFDLSREVASSEVDSED